jgi:lipopolysaccharide transport system ATP-binding protein
LLFVSHDTHSVVNLCQHALWLEHGRIAAYGNAREVCDAYLGSFFENRLGEIAADENETGDGDASPAASAIAVPVGAAPETASGEFGLGGARILSVNLLQPDGKPLAVLTAAGPLCLRVSFRTRQRIEQPIIGFFVKDRLGQMICGDNSIKQLGAVAPLEANRQYTAEFRFDMPQLATGTYTIGVAVGAGTQQSHVQHHWIHDALAFKAEADPAMTGVWVLRNLQVQLDPVPPGPA